MYAVVEQGGKQHKVSAGDVIDIELTEVDSQAKTIELNKVLLVGDGQSVQVGTPYLEGAKVFASFKISPEAAVVKGPKLHPTYFRRRKNSTKRIGHRQKYLQIIIDSIVA